MKPKGNDSVKSARIAGILGLPIAAWELSLGFGLLLNTARSSRSIKE